MSYATPVQGIRLVYGGYRMRSRLETHLATTLDALGVQWRYEVERLRLHDGRVYIPDFTILDDPQHVVGADLIEVKDNTVVSRCAETLGVGYKTTQALHDAYRWSEPMPVGFAFSQRTEWQALEKPLKASVYLERVVLIYGKTSFNAPVLRITPDGYASARRAHVLHRAGGAVNVRQLEEQQGRVAEAVAQHDRDLAHEVAEREHHKRGYEDFQRRQAWIRDYCGGSVFAS